MGEDRHFEIGKINNFNATPGENYRDNCKPPRNWGSFQFKQKGAGGKTVSIGHNAHHVLSVSSVNKSILDVEEDAQEYVRECCEVTTWSINNKNNMLALPLFGHTVLWYLFKEEDEAPPFEDLPQHNFDHDSTNGYCDEIRESLARLWNSLNKKREEHDLDPQSIAGALKNLENYWKKELKNRATRHEGGTHKAWLDGDAHPNGQWYLSFSMAKASAAKKRRFPVAVKHAKDILKKLNKIVGR